MVWEAEGTAAVSIRAPARGATCQNRSTISGGPSFNPRPCARGDRPGSVLCWILDRFNPRPCARGDLYPGRLLPLSVPVSIRAPARGATRRSELECDLLRGFQSAPLREGRLPRRAIRPTDTPVSIRAPARGATRYQRICHRTHVCFNPRPCARGDWSRRSPGMFWRWFQSAPLREGRRAKPSSRSSSTESGFNPRPCARGDWSDSNALTSRRLGFNPRPCARGDPKVVAYVPAPWRVSIRAPARGATAPSRSSGPRCSCFNPRPCARGDAGQYNAFGVRGLRWAFRGSGWRVGIGGFAGFG